MAGRLAIVWPGAPSNQVGSLSLSVPGCQGEVRSHDLCGKDSRQRKLLDDQNHAAPSSTEITFDNKTGSQMCD